MKYAALFAPLLLISTGASAATIGLQGGSISLPVTTGVTTFSSQTFSTPFSTPPVVVALMNTDGGQSGALRIRNVTISGFEIIQVEPNLNDGPHAAMQVGWFAMEPTTGGFVDLGNGVLAQAGFHATSTTTQSGTDSSFDTFSFPTTAFGAAPVVLADLQTTSNETGAIPNAPSVPWITPAVKNITATGFDVSLDRGSATSGTISSDETVGWIALTTGNSQFGSTDFVVTRTSTVTSTAASHPLGFTFGSTPIAVATINSRNENVSGGWLRGAASATNLINLGVQETESNFGSGHPTQETAGILAFAAAFDSSASLQAGAIPEPARALLLLAGLTSISLVRRRR